jgi:hypothetical protein
MQCSTSQRQSCRWAPPWGLACCSSQPRQLISMTVAEARRCWYCAVHRAVVRDLRARSYIDTYRRKKRQGESMRWQPAEQQLDGERLNSAALASLEKRRICSAWVSSMAVDMFCQLARPARPIQTIHGSKDDAGERVRFSGEHVNVEQRSPVCRLTQALHLHTVSKRPVQQ